LLSTGILIGVIVQHIVKADAEGTYDPTVHGDILLKSAAGTQPDDA
jgi:hypothetical protein